MTEDKRFYGIYLGICIDNRDPDESDRIKLTVPQVLGDSVSEWALPCLPIIANADHPDHLDHTASQVAALLTTTSTSVQGGMGGTVPALTVVAKNSNKLTHTHETTDDEYDTQTASPQHTYHRTIPNLKQKVWVMFMAGDPNFPVWMGVLQ